MIRPLDTWLSGKVISCDVKNSAGTTATNYVTMTVTEPTAKPVITKQPAAASAKVGSPMTFSVTATGATSYYWYVCTEDGSGAETVLSWDTVRLRAAVSGERTSTVTITPTQTWLNGKTIACNVKNAGGSTHSNKVKITVTDPSAPIPTVAIKNNPGAKTINYGDGITFTAITTDLPADAQIKWYVNGVEKSTGETFTYSNITSNSTVTVKLTDTEGNVLKNADGDEISASETINCKAGFFKKLINFFKNLFKASRIVVQSIAFE